jgi:hypothetical protein
MSFFFFTSESTRPPSVSASSRNAAMALSISALSSAESDVLGT